jgi:hypothetical protein
MTRLNVRLNHNAAQAATRPWDKVAALRPLPADQMPRGNPLLILGLAVAAWVPFLAAAVVFLR